MPTCSAATRGAPDAADLAKTSARLHHHLCPRRVLGVPQTDKRLLAIAETDGA